MKFRFHSTLYFTIHPVIADNSFTLIASLRNKEVTGLKLNACRT